MTSHNCTAADLMTATVSCASLAVIAAAQDSDTRFGWADTPWGSDVIWMPQTR